MRTEHQEDCLNERSRSLPVVIHPFIEMVGNVEATIVVGGELKVDKDDRVVTEVVVPDKNVASIDIIVREHYRTLQPQYQTQQPVHLGAEVNTGHTPGRGLLLHWHFVQLDWLQLTVVAPLQ